MTIDKIVAIAATALRVYQQLGDLARAYGMKPAEFAAEVQKEINRINRWLESTDADEDAVFRAKDR